MSVSFSLGRLLSAETQTADSTVPTQCLNLEGKDGRIFNGWNGWLLLFAALQAFNTIFFFVGYFCLHISIIDISWGLMPLIPLTMLLVERIVICGAASVTAISIVAYVLIAIWGIRLAQHIIRRYHGADARYIELEKFDAKCPEPFKGFLIWFKIFVFQACCSICMADTAVKIFYYSKPEDTFGVFEIVGIVVWVIGFTFEVIGDWQLDQFIKNPNKVPGQVIDTGLWRYTRHPNYFGECLLWYAIYFMACGGSTGPAGGYYTFYSPLLMHWMLRCFSGVLILEAKQKRKPAFRVYMMETNIFVPWCYKKIDGKEREDLIEKFRIEIAEEQKSQRGSILFGLYKKEWKQFLFKGGPKDDEEPVVQAQFSSVAADPEKTETKKADECNVLELQNKNSNTAAQ